MRTAICQQTVNTNSLEIQVHPLPTTSPPVPAPSAAAAADAVNLRRAGGGAGNKGSPGAGARAVTGPAPAVAAPGGEEIKPQLFSLLLSRTGQILTDEQLDKHLKKMRINGWDKILGKLQG
jgi:hypothetical protein